MLWFSYIANIWKQSRFFLVYHLHNNIEIYLNQPIKWQGCFLQRKRKGPTIILKSTLSVSFEPMRRGQMMTSIKVTRAWKEILCRHIYWCSIKMLVMSLGTWRWPIINCLISCLFACFPQISLWATEASPLNRLHLLTVVILRIQLAQSSPQLPPLWLPHLHYSSTPRWLR